MNQQQIKKINENNNHFITMESGSMLLALGTCICIQLHLFLPLQTIFLIVYIVTLILSLLLPCLSLIKALFTGNQEMYQLTKILFVIAIPSFLMLIFF